MTNQIMKIHSKTCRFVASNAMKRCDCGMAELKKDKLEPGEVRVSEEA